MATRTIRLSRGDTVKFSELPRFIAEALYDNEDERVNAETALRYEFEQMVNAGTLTVRDPQFLNEQIPSIVNGLANSVLTADDLRPLFKAKGLSIETGRQSYDRIFGHDYLPADTYPYTDAAQDIAHAHGWSDVRRDELEGRMWNAIKAGLLPTYDYKTGLRHENGAPERDLFFLVKSDDVNAWLGSMGVTHRWLPPDAVHAPADAFIDIGDAPEAMSEANVALRPMQEAPMQRSQAQDTEILKLLSNKGYEPLELPPYRPGVAGVKAEIKSALGNKGMWSGATVFDKAWERLSGSGRIAYKK